jgi:acetylglutamate synthase
LGWIHKTGALFITTSRSFSEFHSIRMGHIIVCEVVIHVSIKITTQSLYLALEVWLGKDVQSGAAVPKDAQLQFLTDQLCE